MRRLWPGRRHHRSGESRTFAYGVAVASWTGALVAEIPGARLLFLERAGYGVDQAGWDTIVAAIVEQTDPTV